MNRFIYRNRGDEHMNFKDFRSDTTTQPTEMMRKAIASAIVGDDGYDDDPTTKLLEEKAAALLGKESALFVPSGTFANQLAILTHTRRGDEIILGHDSHTLIHEVGATAVIAGVHSRSTQTINGTMDIEDIVMKIREDDIHFPHTALICIENAHSSGAVVPLSNMKAVYNAAKQRNISVHLDGSRFFNAARHLKVDYKDMAQYADSLSICLSKGLCAPVGSLLIGKKSFIEKAKRNRKLMGGAMRQTGILAAAGIVAIENMIDRLENDHDNAKYLADSLETIENLRVFRERLDINLVFFTLPETVIEEDKLVQGLFEAGFKVSGKSHGEYRFVTSNNITRKDIDELVTKMKELIKNR